MSLYVEDESGIEFPFDEKETAELVIVAALDYAE